MAQKQATANHPTVGATPAGPALRSWPADKIARWAIDRIKPHPQNPLIHSNGQVEQIAASMMRFGVTAPLLVDEEGVLIYGHGRLRAASLLLSRGRGEFSSLPVVIARGWTEDEKRAYRIADNQIAYLADWDMPVLKAELATLNRAGFDIPLLGFSDDRVRQILANPQSRDPDAESEAPPAVAVTMQGDVWICGAHRLLCSDATNPSSVEQLLAGAKPHLLVSDPPYGVDYDPDWRNRAARTSSGMGNRMIGAGAVGKVVNDDRCDWREAWLLFGGDVAYVWHAGLYASSVQISLEASGFDVRSQIIWAKQQFAIGRGDYHWKHEPCWYAVRQGKTGHWNGDRTQATVWDINKPQKSESGHSTQKPVECMKRPMENNSVPGDTVYDPFIGSGTTMVAAELLARKCYGMEIDAGYVDVAVKRWQKISGRQAILEISGATFDEVAQARGVEVTAERELTEVIAAGLESKPKPAVTY